MDTMKHGMTPLVQGFLLSSVWNLGPIIPLVWTKSTCNVARWLIGLSVSVWSITRLTCRWKVAAACHD